MSFDSEERAVLAGLADVLIPAGEGFPSASDAGVAREGLDQVLAFRPDLADGLERLDRRRPWMSGRQSSSPSCQATIRQDSLCSRSSCPAPTS